MKKYDPNVQVLRGALFLFVLAFHCGVPYASLGWAGVEAFFVISAFFLVRKLWDMETVNVKEQFVHRIRRLYPPYIAVLIVAATYALLAKRLPYDAVPHLFSVQNFLWMFTGYSSPMQPMTAHTWTLSIEIWGGLLLLLALKYFTKNQFKTAMYIMLVLGITYRTILSLISVKYTENANNIYIIYYFLMSYCSFRRFCAGGAAGHFCPEGAA